MPDYTITITVDGTSIPAKLRASGAEFKVFGDTVKVEIGKARSSVKQFKETTEEMQDRLTQAFSALQPSIDYMTGLAQAVLVSDSAAEKYIKTKQLEQQVTQAGLSLTSKEGQEYLELVTVYDTLENKVKEYQATRKRIDDEATERLYQATLAREKEEREMAFQAEKVQVLSASLQREIDYRTQLNSLIRTNTDAAEQLTATYTAENQAMKLGIDIETEEGQALVVLIERKNELAAKSKSLEQAEVQASKAAQKEISNEIGRLQELAIAEDKARSKALAQRAKVTTAVSDTRQETADLEARYYAVKMGDEAERLFAASIAARTEIQRLGIAVDSEEAAIIQKNAELQANLRAETEELNAAQQGHVGTLGTLISTIATLAVTWAAFSLKEWLSDSVQAVIQWNQIERAIAVASDSAVVAKVDLQFVRDETKRLGLELQGTAEAFSKLDASAKGTGLQGQHVRDIFTSVAEASTVLHLSAERTNLILYAIQQTISRGTVSSQQLKRELGQSLPGAFQIAARAMGETTEQLEKQLRAGKLLAEDFLPKFAEELHKTYGSGLDDAMNGVLQNINRFKTEIFETKVALGEAFTPAFEAAMSKISEAFLKDKDSVKEFGETAGKYLVDAVDLIITIAKHAHELEALLIFYSIAKAIGVAREAFLAFETLFSIAEPEWLAVKVLIGGAAAVVYLFHKELEATQNPIHEIDKVLLEHRDILLQVKATTLDVAQAQAILAKTDVANLQTQLEQASNAQTKLIDDLNKRYDAQVKIMEINHRLSADQFGAKTGPGGIQPPAPFKAPAFDFNKLATQEEKDQLQLYNNQLNILTQQLQRAKDKQKEFEDNIISLQKTQTQATHSTDTLTKSEKRHQQTIEEKIALQEKEAKLEQQITIARDKEATFKDEIQGTLESAGVNQKYISSLVEIINQSKREKSAVRELEDEQDRARKISSLGLEVSDKQKSAYEERIKLQQQEQNSQKRSHDLEVAVNAIRKDALGVIESINRQQANFSLKGPQQQLEELTKDLFDVKAAIQPLEIALNNLKPGTKEYADTLDALNKLIALNAKLTKEQADAQRAQQNQIDQKATASVDKYTNNLIKRQNATLSSTLAERDFNRELEIQSQILTLLADKKLSPETYVKLSEQIRAAMERGFQIEDFQQDFVQPFDSAVQSMRDTFVNAFVDMFSGVDVKWGDLLKDLYRQWLKTVFEIEAKQLALKIFSNGGGSGGENWTSYVVNIANYAGGGNNATSGGTGGVAGLGSGVGGWAGLAGHAGAFWGSAGTGVAGSGSGVVGLAGGTGGAGAVGMVAFWAAILVAFGLGVNALDKHLQKTKESIITFNDDLKINGIGDNHFEGLLTAGEAFAKDVRGFFTNFGAIFEKLQGDISIKRRGQGRNTEWKVYADGLVKNFGNDAEAAFNYAEIQAIKESKSFGLDPLVQSTITNYVGESMDAFKAQIDFAQRLATQNLPQVAGDVRGAATQFFADIQQAYSQFQNDLPNLRAALESVLTKFTTSLWQSYDQLTGHKEDPVLQHEREVRAYNIQSTLVRAQIILLEIQIKAQIADYKAGQAHAHGIINHTEVMIIATKALGDATDDFLQSMLDELAALDQALRDMPPLIPDITGGGKGHEGGHRLPGEHDPSDQHGGGAGSQRRSDQDQLKQDLHNADISRASAYLQALDQIQQKWDEEAKLAHGNKDLLAKVNAERQKEIELLTQQTRAQLDPYIKDWGKSDFQKQIEQQKEVFDELRKLPRAVMPKWMIDLAEGHWLQDQVKNIQERIAQQSGEDSTISQIKNLRKQNDELVGDIRSLGLSAGQTADLINQANAATQNALNTIANQVVGNLLNYVKDLPAYHDDIIKYQQQQVQLQFALLQAQLRTLGIWDQYAQLWQDAYNESMKNASTIESQNQAAVSDGTDAITQALEDQRKAITDGAKEFYDLVKEISDYKNSLNFSEYSPYSSRDQYNLSKSNLETLAPKALSGDIDAYRQIKDAIDNFLKSSQALNGSGAGYQVDYSYIQSLLTQLGNAQFTYNGVTYPASFFENNGQWQWPTTGDIPAPIPGGGTASAPGAGAAPHQTPNYGLGWWDSAGQWHNTGSPPPAATAGGPAMPPSQEQTVSFDPTVGYFDSAGVWHGPGATASDNLSRTDINTMLASFNNLNLTTSDASAKNLDKLTELKTSIEKVSTSIDANSQKTANDTQNLVDAMGQVKESVNAVNETMGLLRNDIANYMQKANQKDQTANATLKSAAQSMNLALKAMGKK